MTKQNIGQSPSFLWHWITCSWITQTGILKSPLARSHVCESVPCESSTPFEGPLPRADFGPALDKQLGKVYGWKK